MWKRRCMRTRPSLLVREGSFHWSNARAKFSSDLLRFRSSVNGPLRWCDVVGLSGNFIVNMETDTDALPIPDVTEYAIVDYRVPTDWKNKNAFSSQGILSVRKSGNHGLFGLFVYLRDQFLSGPTF